MKRSEILDIMYSVIERNTGKLTNDKEVLSEILDAIEEAGMEQPGSLWDKE